MSESEEEYLRNLLKLRSDALNRMADRAQNAEETVKVLRGSVKALLAGDDKSAQEMAQKTLTEAYSHARQEDIRLFLERDEWKVMALEQRRIVMEALTTLRKYKTEDPEVLALVQGLIETLEKSNERD